MRALLIPIPCSSSDPLLLSGAAPQNSHTGSFRGQTHPHRTTEPQPVFGTVISLGFQPHTRTCLHLMIFIAINVTHPPWGLICTTVSHKSGVLRACQQLIDIQEQFPWTRSRVKAPH